MTQKERQERSREEIYRAALDEFGTHGYDSVNMERICGRHGISKGMMYHYYSGKDPLFLLCVEKTFADLKRYIEDGVRELPEGSVLGTIKAYFMMREYYFQTHPKQKVIFEEAMLRPPKHLAAQIQELRAPIREMNRKFLGRQTARIPLRAGLDRKKVSSYLEGVGGIFQTILAAYRGETEEQDLHAMLETAEELLDLILFGVLQPESGTVSASGACAKG